MRRAAIKRKADAWRLLSTCESQHARAAGYLGGYAIECKLKAIAMEIHECFTLADLALKRKVHRQDVYTHGLEVFAKRLTPTLWKRLLQSDVSGDFRAQVNRWRTAWRYSPKDWTCGQAESFLRAVDRVYQWLESNRA